MLLALSVLPVVVLMVYIYLQDKYQKEPIKVLAKAFIGGMLSIPLTLFLVHIINNIYYSETAFYSAFMEAGLPEELSKFTFLFLFIWRNKAFDEYMDGIVYAAFVSLGFACIENIMYVFGSSAESLESGVSTGVVRALLSVPGHFLFGVIMGYFFSRAKFNKNGRTINLILSVFCAALAHGIFDWLLMIQDFLSNGLATIIYVVFLWADIKLWKIGLKFIKKQQVLSENQARVSFDGFPQGDTNHTFENEPEYKHIDWNAGNKN